MSTVFVSGANGFIAQHLVKQLVAKGYKIIGSVRTKERGEKVQKNMGSNFQYVVIPDFTKEDAFYQVLKDNPEIQGFFHVASPLAFDLQKYEEEIILPALRGTENALVAVKKFGLNVKRFVFTSSSGTLNAFNDTKDVIVNEESWSDVLREKVDSSLYAYAVSKVYAEKLVWEFVEKEHPHFTVNSMNPMYMLGPQVFDNEVKPRMNNSAEIIASLLRLKPTDPIPVQRSGFVDVRDAARAHIFAYESDVTNFRFFLYAERFSIQKILDIIHKHFKLDIPVGVPHSGDDFSDLAQMHNQKTTELVGPFISLEQSVVDAVQQVLDNIDKR